jgi:mannose-6-phosphate isomerase-like protein (cupin superfamily)
MCAVVVPRWLGLLTWAMLAASSWQQEGGLTATTATCTLDVVNAEQLSAADFHRKYVLANRPVVLRNFNTSASGWLRSDAWARDHAALGATFGDAPLASRWGEGGYLFGLRVRPVTMRAYLRSMAHPRAGLLFNSSRVGMGELWTIPSLFEGEGMTSTVISVGPAGRGLPFHNHGSTWEAIVRGSKRFALVPPIGAAEIAARGAGWPGRRLFQTLALAPPPPSGTAAAAAAHHHRSSAVAAAALGRVLAAAGLRSERCTVEQGQAIYIPCNWYHATENSRSGGGDAAADGTTVAIAGQWEPAGGFAAGAGVQQGQGQGRGRGQGQQPATDGEPGGGAGSGGGVGTTGGPEEEGGRPPPPASPTSPTSPARHDTCPSDVHADFRQQFRQVSRLVAMAAGGGGSSSGPSQAGELLHEASVRLERACALTPVRVGEVG